MIRRNPKLVDRECQDVVREVEVVVGRVAFQGVAAQGVELVPDFRVLVPDPELLDVLVLPAEEGPSTEMFDSVLCLHCYHDKGSVLASCVVRVSSREAEQAK
jgi:hypothetical protein